MLDDYELRAQLLEDELTEIAAIVRKHDPRTPLCINPNQTLNNHAQYGYRLERLACGGRRPGGELPRSMVVR